jgi:hypothetical protein
MTNADDPTHPPASVDVSPSITSRIQRDGRSWFLARPSLGIFVAPFLYVPAAISANRSFLAIVAGVWLLGQVTAGILLLIGDGDDETPTGMGPAIGAQLIGIAPWVPLIFAWSALTTMVLTGLLPLLAAWGTLALLISGGAGARLGQRIRGSTYRLVALVTTGVFGFAGFVVALMLLIKALHPLR